jgi:hypothetical protein
MHPSIRDKYFPEIIFDLIYKFVIILFIRNKMNHCQKSGWVTVPPFTRQSTQYAEEA